MMYTVIPPELLEAQPSAPQAVCVKCPYGYVEGVRNGQGGVVVSRVISTDPAAYLDPRLAPGQVYQEVEAF